MYDRNLETSKKDSLEPSSSMTFPAKTKEGLNKLVIKFVDADIGSVKCSW